MFRRRTLTSVDLSSPSVVETNQLSASSPSSPLQHQLQQQHSQQQQHLTKNPPTVVGNTLSVPAHGYAGTSASSTSLPTSPLSLSPSPSVIAVGSQSCATNKAASSSPNNSYNYMQHHTSSDVTSAMSLSTSLQQHHQHHQQQYSTSSSTTTTTTGRILGTCGGIGVLPGAFNGRTSLSGGFFASKDKIIGNSSTVGLLARDTKLKSTGTDSSNDLEGNREMTDSQRSLSEGRLVDSDFSRDGLSQSHDSVFSESATASSLSIVLKAELADVLRKRRNRPDASDEDLGLPRSPTTPQRRETNNTTNQSEVSSLSMLSMNSTIDFDDELPSSTANHSGDFSSVADRTSSSISSKFSGGDNSRSEDVELFSSNWTRLSHSAAKHKMAVRPVKKKGPTRHRRTLESSVLPSTPEVNEDQTKATASATLEVKDISLDKAKSRSLPPGVNAKILEQHSTEMKQAVSIKRSKTEKGPSPNSTYAMRSNATKSSIFESVSPNAQSSPTDTNKDDESGFFRRFVYRNSKRGASKSTSTNNGNNKNADELDSQPESKKPNPPPTEISKSIETKSAEYSQKVEETRKDIRRDILSTGNSALSAMLNTFILSPESEKMVTHATNENITINQSAKPKSGPAARQRYIPKDLSQQQQQQPQPMMMDVDVNLKHSRTSLESFSEKSDSHMRDEFISKSIALSKISKSHTEESFQSTTLVREINAMKDQQKEHFEKKPKILGMSAFQQKISRSNDSFNNTSSSTDSVEFLLGSDLRKRGKSVEKSKSFRTYIESKEDKEIASSLRNQVPSLPDLSLKSDNDLEDEKHLSLGFEINDNNLVKQKSSELPLTHGIYTKNIILTTSKNMPSRIQTKSPLLGTSACSTNISEIEQNIDMLVKSPFVSVLRKSATISDSVSAKLAPNVTISPIPNKRIDTIAKVENKIDRILRTEDKDIFVPPATPAAPPPTPATPPPALVAPIIIHSPTKVQMREKPKIVADSESRKSLRERNSSPQTTISSKSNSFHRSRRSSSVIESSASNNKGVPEFMKIQLNRVDPIRPKSNVVLSKNVRESTEDLTRRFSNESVEISEVKPPTPTEDDRPTVMIRSNSSTSSRSDESLPKSPTKKTSDEENNILRIDTNTPFNNNIPLHERRRLFLSEDKLKNDRKIEEMKLERKKSMSEEVRKMPTEEEPVVVVLRKKSFGVIQPSANNNKDDPTPELMKVFARRSLKIKDEDLPDPPIKKFVPSVDSDKENQSSSEEKLDKLSAIQQQQNGLPKTDTDISKNRNSLADFRNNKSQSLNNNGIGTPTKTFLPPIRLSGPFRQSSQGSPVMVGKSIESTTNNNNNNNNSLTNNNNNVSTKPVERQSLATVTVLSSSVPPSVVNTSTIEQNSFSTSTTFTRSTIERSATMATMNRVESEFKGIHQRRAEWEKRAKEALK
ncbi:putative mediator of RNA polymerase II transcription subunit 26 isoform X2 [Episyrphus balteatus]|nr:putative mediator of RNA polymerase II transcription subunit 26 isoform X2 [Episyrphus balteatus]